MTPYELLLSQIDEEVSTTKEALARGSVKTYDEYQKLCGVIKGLRIASIFIEDLKQKSEDGYEDDD